MKQTEKTIGPKIWDVTILGAGPAGLAAALASEKEGASVCIVEREDRPGGILKQCIHDGFGLIRFREKLTGPEYAARYVSLVRERGIPVFLGTFLTRTEEAGNCFKLTLVSPDRGVYTLTTRTIVLATGCRERTDRQVFIHGERPSGVYTAGLAQYFVNIQGFLPGKRAVILGSGDIGLIMARRLTLEGAEVAGVYEIKNEPSGLTRNIVQCLEDYGIPLRLSRRVVKIHGSKRIAGVTLAAVDENFQTLAGTEEEVACDTLILSVGLIPENEAAENLGISLDPSTRGPRVNQNMMTEKPGIFICGNALHINDLVDYVSENGERAGRAAAEWAGNPKTPDSLASIEKGANILTLVPQVLTPNSSGQVPIFFRGAKTLRNVRFTLKGEKNVLLDKKYEIIRPPEMERLVLKLSADMDFRAEGRLKADLIEEGGIGV